jgi:hypothetical protein
MHQQFCAAMAGTLLALAPATMIAQAPAIPALPMPTYSSDFFTAVMGTWSFQTCGVGVIEYVGGSPIVSGTAACFTGLVTVGYRPFEGEPGVGSLRMWIDVNQTHDPRLASGSLRGALFGTVPLEDCWRPIGSVCAVGSDFTVPAVGSSGQQTRRAGQATFLGLAEFGAPFTPGDFQLLWEYRAVNTPNPGDELIMRTTLTPVPEPATYALLGTGLLGLGGVALRRRRRAA